MSVHQCMKLPVHWGRVACLCDTLHPTSRSQLLLSRLLSLAALGGLVSCQSQLGRPVAARVLLSTMLRQSKSCMAAACTTGNLLAAALHCRRLCCGDTISTCGCVAAAWQLVVCVGSCSCLLPRGGRTASTAEPSQAMLAARMQRLPVAGLWNLSKAWGVGVKSCQLHPLQVLEEHEAIAVSTEECMQCLAAQQLQLEGQPKQVGHHIMLGLCYYAAAVLVAYWASLNAQWAPIVDIVSACCPESSSAARFCSCMHGCSQSRAAMHGKSHIGQPDTLPSCASCACGSIYHIRPVYTLWQK
jgi:hypothetical protein